MMKQSPSPGGNSPDRRETLTHLFDAARVEGLAYLFALIALGRITVPELSDLSGDERHRIGRYLRRLESRGFAMRTQNGHGELWFPTPRALELFGLGGASPANLLVDFLPPNPSSSSDQIRSSKASDSDLISEEEEESLRYIIYLNRHFNLIGPKAEALLGDPWVTPLRLVAWMQQVRQMERDKFHFTKNPESYAIHCLLRHDEPSRDAYHLAPAALDQILRWMPRADVEEADPTPDEEETENGG